MAEPDILHFHTSSDDDFRILNHFYAVIHFTKPSIDNYYKRFVRDFIHYHDKIYCAAGKIIQALQDEGKQRGFNTDEEGGGGYSAWHVRRGDLQYKEGDRMHRFSLMSCHDHYLTTSSLLHEVIIPAEEWWENTAKLWQPKEILYIATDEKDTSFFDPIAKHHDIRYLKDYWVHAGLDKMDPNFMGMVEIVVCSRGRLFVGTWHSTFSSYIMRLRGAFLHYENAIGAFGQTNNCTYSVPKDTTEHRRYQTTIHSNLDDFGCTNGRILVATTQQENFR